MKAFYQNTVTLKWELIDNLDNLIQLIPGTCKLKTNSDRTHIWIEEGKESLGVALITDVIKNSDGDKYEDFDEFDVATKDFFVNAALVAANKLDARVTVLEERQVIFIDYKGNVTPTSPDEGFIWYEDSTNLLFTYVGSSWLTTPLSVDSIYVDRATTIQYSWTGSTLIQMTVPLTKVAIEALLYNGSVIPSAYTIDLQVADVFTKTLTGSTQFTISNPINYKPFRLILTGGTLNTALFSGYTATWAASTLIDDYVPASSNILYCEIRGTGLITVFWGE